MMDEPNCTTAECVSANEGRERIRQKLSAISEHYEKVVDIDLQAIRDVIQAKIDAL